MFWLGLETPGMTPPYSGQSKPKLKPTGIWRAWLGFGSSLVFFFGTEIGFKIVFYASGGMPNNDLSIRVFGIKQQLGSQL
jgi:hypothetical protein